MQVKELISDVGVGMIGGYVGTQVMERVAMKLYELESEEARRQEDEARPGEPPIVAARKTTQWLGLELSEEQIETLGMYLFHYGLGMSWGPLYTLLRRETTLGPVSAGLLVGAAMSILVDEGDDAPLGLQRPQPRLPARDAPQGRRRTPGFRAGRRGHRRDPLLVGPQWE